MCVSVLPGCILVHNMHAWCPQRSEEVIRFPGKGVKDGCTPPCGCWESNMGPQEEQPVFLSTESLLLPFSFMRIS